MENSKDFSHHEQTQILYDAIPYQVYLLKYVYNRGDLDSL